MADIYIKWTFMAEGSINYKSQPPSPPHSTTSVTQEVLLYKKRKERNRKIDF